MFGIRHILIFVAWVACLGGAYVATMTLPPGLSGLPAFLAWSAFIFISITFLALSFIGSRRNSRIMIGASVFAIASIILFYHADMNSAQTPGTLITDSILFTAEPIVPPYSYSGTLGNGASEMTVNSEPTDEQLADRDQWNFQRESVAYIIDLFVSSCMTLFGAYLGAFTKNDAQEMAR